ncbi:MAG TPA: histidinol-phosphate transaminase [Azospirillaceae bacterium]|nr:histidinol-phosphate transaminase [Azospirillaceae bacterium]
MPAPQPRPGILDIAAYVGGEAHAAGASRQIRLASNEGALGPSPRAMEAYRRVTPDIHRYPDGGSAQLREALGKRYGLDPARIVCGTGSDDLLTLLARAYAGPGDEVVHTVHGFLLYPILATGIGAKPVAVSETNLKADVDALLGAVTERTRVVFVANPNNPTGSYLTVEEMARLHAGLPENVLLVIDAAYAEFVTRNDYSAGEELVDKAPNVVMTRTFSKIFALGGLRLGWAYGSEGIVDVLNRLRGPFNVPLPAQAAGVAALEDVGFIDMARDHNEKWRDWFTSQCRGLGLTVHPSVTNFALVDFRGQAGSKADSEAARQFLKGRGILVRQMGSYKLPDCLRVTIGTGEEMQAVVAGLRDFLAG